MSKSVLEELQEKYIKILENKSDYVIMDTECSGFQQDDEIVEMAIIDLDGKVLLDQRFKPTKSIDPQMSDIHEIDDNSVADAPSFKDEWENIYTIIKDKKLIMYNGDFDVEILNNTLKKYELEIVEFDFDSIMDDMNALHQRGLPIRMLAEEQKDKYSSIDDCYIVLHDIIERYSEDYF